MKDGFKHWDDTCPVGRNLYRLLIAQESYNPQRVDTPFDRDTTSTRSSKSLFRRTPVGFGQLSHATSHSFLGIAENAQYIGSWDLTPTKIGDEIKAFLLAERQAQEWDVLNQKEWEDMENLIAEDPVLVGDKRRKDGGVDDGRRGISGFVKLKSRAEGQ
jgi:hypothetical protein